MTEGTHPSLLRAAAHARKQNAKDLRRQLANAKKLSRGSGPRPRRSGASGRTFYKSKVNGGRKTAPAALLRLHPGGLASDRYAEKHAEQGYSFGTFIGQTSSQRKAEWALELAKRPDIQDPSRLVVHVSISLPANHYRTPSQWRLLAEAWLDEAGFHGCAHLAQAHINQTAHDHLHLTVSRIREDNRLVSDGWSKLKYTEAMARACKKLGIKDVPVDVESGAEKPASDRQAATQRMAKRKGLSSTYIDPKIVQAVLEKSTSLDQFKSVLVNNYQITVAPSFSTTGKQTGLVYTRGGVSLAGSSLSRDFSAAAVGRAIKANQTRETDHQPHQAYRNTLAQAARRAQVNSQRPGAHRG